MRYPTPLVALLALLSAAAARADTSIQNFYLEVQARLAALPADPFQPLQSRLQRLALLSSQAGRELHVPPPAAGIVRVGSAQKLWPLELEDGQLHLSFSTGGGYAPLMEDNPWNLWVLDRDGPAHGEKTDDGRGCRRYTARSGYGIQLPPIRAVQVYVDDRYRLPGQSAEQMPPDGLFRLNLAASVADARALSGHLATYVRLSALDEVDAISERIAGLRVSSTGHCYGGDQRLLIGRIDRLRVIDQRSGEELLRLRFRY